MPIRLKKTGTGAQPPQTVAEAFEKTLKDNANKPALSVKRNGKW